jgi:hypothetical protein
MNRRTWLLTSAIIGLGLAGLTAPAQAQDTIKIGEMNSYKNFAAFLEPYKKGWELAVEQARRSRSSAATITAIPATPCASPRNW